MNGKKSWYEKNRQKKVRTVVDKGFLVDTVELLASKTNMFSFPIQEIREGASGIGFRFRLGELLSRNVLEQLLHPLVEDSDYQEHLIRSLLGSALYKEFVSELLFNSIRDFFLDENVFTQKLPVVGRIIKLGQSMANRTIRRFSDLFENFESVIKNFIEGNLGIMEQYAYAIIKRSITQKNVDNIIDFLWDQFKDRELTVHEALFAPGEEFDLNRLSRLMAESLIDSILAKFGDHRIAELIE